MGRRRSYEASSGALNCCVSPLHMPLLSFSRSLWGKRRFSFGLLWCSPHFPRRLLVSPLPKATITRPPCRRSQTPDTNVENGGGPSNRCPGSMGKTRYDACFVAYCFIVDRYTAVADETAGRAKCSSQEEIERNRIFWSVVLVSRNLIWLGAGGFSPGFLSA